MGFFEYSEEETGYLKSRDKRLGEVIDKTGHIYRQMIIYSLQLYTIL